MKSVLSFCLFAFLLLSFCGCSPAAPEAPDIPSVSSEQPTDSSLTDAATTADQPWETARTVDLFDDAGNPIRATVTATFDDNHETIRKAMTGTLTDFGYAIEDVEADLPEHGMRWVKCTAVISPAGGQLVFGKNLCCTCLLQPLGEEGIAMAFESYSGNVGNLYIGDGGKPYVVYQAAAYDFSDGRESVTVTAYMYLPTGTMQFAIIGSQPLNVISSLPKLPDSSALCWTLPKEVA